MKRFWTADLHLGGGGISQYATRPFKSPNHMNDRLIGNINGRIKPDDFLIHVGDFACYGNDKGVEGLRVKPNTYERLILGKIIHIEGNHDSNNHVKTYVKFMFDTIGSYRVFVSHYPVGSPNNKIINKTFWDDICSFAMRHTEFCICGHVHDSWKFNEYNGYLNLNVGVDVNRYMPISDSEIINQVQGYWKNRT